MSHTQASRRFFTENLLQWHFEENDRELPWKQERDPYKIWLSEIILQQTRAEQGRPYYERFISHYPDVHQLADAPPDEVFRLWQGLGYYNRCRNLLAAAQTISREYAGRFPRTYAEILALKGVGHYTAAAIASFAFGLPYAVLDGNVYRVLSRFFGIDTPIDSTAGKAQFQELATAAMDKERPAAFNQAIMDFGASVCSPKAPACATCPLAPRCTARQRDMVALLPVKSKRINVRERHFHYFVLEAGDEVYIQQRNTKDIWQHLYEFYLIESEEDHRDTPAWQQLQPYILQGGESEFSNRQRLTHQLVISDFHRLSLKARPTFLTGGIWVRKDYIKKYAFPKTILSFFNRKGYF